MKKLFLGLGLALIMFGGTTAHAIGETAIQTRQNWIVNGNNAFIKAYALVSAQGDTNVIAIRDACIEADVFIEFDGAAGRVYIDPNRPYAEDKTTNVTDPYPAAVTTAFSGVAIYVKGKWELMPQYNILDRTYVPIRIIAPHIGLEVDYDGRTNTVYLDKFGTKPTPVPTPRPDGRPDDPQAVARAALQPFINSLNGLSDREKAIKIADKVADKFEYGKSESTADYRIENLWTSDKVLKDECGGYANAFNFICQTAGIPSVIVMDYNHAWNEVYLEGKWWVCDIANYDTARSMVWLLTTYSTYPKSDENPQRTSERKIEALK